MKIGPLIFASVLVGAMPIGNVDGASARMDSSHRTTHGDASSATATDHPRRHAAMHGGGNPTLSGQDAFAAIQEIVAILEGDPATDWSRVDISALRSHLVDMNRLVMDTDVRENAIDGGLEMVVTGRGRTLRAIRAMVPAHAPMIDGLNGWTATAEVTAKGAKLTVTAANAKEVAHIRGLGFYGLMVSGSHHQAHHLGLARGENAHAH